MNMKLSQETVVGLKRLCNKSLIPDDTFNYLLENCVQLIAHETKSENVEIIGTDVKLDAVKAAHASLLVLFTEGARHDVDGFMLKTILEEYNLPHERIIQISERYAKYRSFARQRLQVIGTNLPHIVDIKWRMDYPIKADDKKCFLEPLFYIDLVTLTSHSVKKTVRFVCTVHNLEELVFALKNAVRHMTKLGNTLK